MNEEGSPARRLPDNHPVLSRPPQAASRMPRCAVWTGRELSELPDRGEADMLVGPLVVRGARTIIVGDTGHGKTTLATQLAAGALTGAEVLGYTGAGEGPVAIVDLEQGLRSLQRTAREVGFDQRNDVLYVHAPDGLSLDTDEVDRKELEDVIAHHRPAVLTLDPYYKAHRGDSNEERAVVDLMRYLDRLRSTYGFALILPAHPRKDPGSNGARKLTLHDVAGSGAAVRGAEVVIAIERLSHGYARLRILKDRDGDLPVGEAWPLLFSRGEGFMLDPKEEKSDDELEERITADTTAEWRTAPEYGIWLGIRESKAKALCERLAESGILEFAEGPPGRHARARCYRTPPPFRADSGGITQMLDVDDNSATPPDSLLETSGNGRSPTTTPEPGGVETNGSSPDRNAIASSPHAAGPTSPSVRLSSTSESITRSADLCHERRAATKPVRTSAGGRGRVVGGVVGESAAHPWRPAT